MALDLIKVTCPSCENQFRKILTRSFLGFQKTTCPSCQEKITYPLTSGFRTTYRVIAVLMVIMIGVSLVQGNIGFPGIIGIAIIYALIRDWQIRKDLAHV